MHIIIVAVWHFVVFLFYLSVVAAYFNGLYMGTQKGLGVFLIVLLLSLIGILRDYIEFFS